MISNDTTLSVTGVGPGEVIDGRGKTRLFRVVNASLRLYNLEIINGNATFGGEIMAINSTIALYRTSFLNGNTGTIKNGGAMFLYRSSVSFTEKSVFINKWLTMVELYMR